MTLEHIWEQHARRYAYQRRTLELRILKATKDLEEIVYGDGNTTDREIIRVIRELKGDKQDENY